MKTNPFDDDFDWFAFLEQPYHEIKRCHIVEASLMANNWVTCACGQLCKDLPRDLSGEPEDPLLKELGIEFMQCINRIEDEIEPLSNKDRAIELLTEIEKTTTKLLQEQQS